MLRSFNQHLICDTVCASVCLPAVPLVLVCYCTALSAEHSRPLVKPAAMKNYLTSAFVKQLKLKIFIASVEHITVWQRAPISLLPLIVLHRSDEQIFSTPGVWT